MSFRTLVKRLAHRAGLEIRRSPRLSLPSLRSMRCEDEEFEFWIANEHTAEWWGSGAVALDAELRFLRSAARAGATVIEVGAHHGMHTLQLSRWVGGSGVVHAFELNADNALVLAANVGVNRLANVRVVRAAVAERSGRITVEGERVSSGGESVHSVSLDEYCEEQGVERVDLLKIDVEGFEAAVLRGARGLLEAKPCVSLELHLDDVRRYGESAESVLSEIAVDDYLVSMMVRPDWHHVEEIRGVADLPVSGVVNLFFDPRR